MHAVARLAVTALAAAILALPFLGADAASAADEIALSPDGVSFASALPGSLFTDVGKMVPSDSHAVKFWLRNDSSGTAYLRMSLADARTDDTDYASALSMYVVVNGVRGERTTFSDAGLCGSLMTAQRVEAGEVVPVESVLVLSDIGGTSGQASRASLTMNVSLSDVPPGSEKAGSCATSGVDIPIVSPPERPTDTATSTPVSGGIFAISDGLFHAWGVLWPMVGFVAGVFLFVLFRRKRHHDDGDDGNHDDPNHDDTEKATVAA